MQYLKSCKNDGSWNCNGSARSMWKETWKVTWIRTTYIIIDVAISAVPTKTFSKRYIFAIEAVNAFVTYFQSVFWYTFTKRRPSYGCFPFSSLRIWPPSDQNQRNTKLWKHYRASLILLRLFILCLTIRKLPTQISLDPGWQDVRHGYASNSRLS